MRRRSSPEIVVCLFRDKCVAAVSVTPATDKAERRVAKIKSPLYDALPAASYVLSDQLDPPTIIKNDC